MKTTNRIGLALAAALICTPALHADDAASKAQREEKAGKAMTTEGQKLEDKGQAIGDKEGKKVEKAGKKLHKKGDKMERKAKKHMDKADKSMDKGAEKGSTESMEHSGH